MNQAILTALRANTALCALLGTQTGGQPAIFYAKRSELPPLGAAGDVVTFRECVLDPDSLFAPTWNEESEYYDFEAWTAKRGSGVLSAIRYQLDVSLNKVVLPLPDPTHNAMRYMRRMAGGCSGEYDKDLREFFGLWRYRAWVRSV